jgi:hypothetical protein
MSRLHRRRHAEKNMKIDRFENLYNELETPFQDGRRDKMLLHRPSHQFKFGSMDIALSTISDEPISLNQIFVEPISMTQIFVDSISMNQIFVEPILTNQIFVEHGSMNRVFLEQGSTKSICSSLVHLSNSNSTYLLHHIILSHSIFTCLIHHNFFRIPSTHLLDQRILSRYISTYLLDHQYSFSPWTKSFLRIYSAHICFRILDIPFYVSTRPYIFFLTLGGPAKSGFVS